MPLSVDDWIEYFKIPSALPDLIEEVKELFKSFNSCANYVLLSQVPVLDVPTSVENLRSFLLENLDELLPQRFGKIMLSKKACLYLENEKKKSLPKFLNSELCKSNLSVLTVLEEKKHVFRGLLNNHNLKYFQRTSAKNFLCQLNKEPNWAKGIVKKNGYLDYSKLTKERIQSADDAFWSSVAHWKDDVFSLECIDVDFFSPDDQTPGELLIVEPMANRIKNTKYLARSSWCSTPNSFFVWHHEDHYRYACNIHVGGWPKRWFIVPYSTHSSPHNFDMFCKLLNSSFKAEQCGKFVQHAEALISPQEIRKHGIEVVEFTQFPGEMVILLDRVMHCGYNMGFCLADGNFWTGPKWADLAEMYQYCPCKQKIISNKDKNALIEYVRLK